MNNQSIKNKEDEKILEAKTPPLPTIKAMNGTSTIGKY